MALKGVPEMQWRSLLQISGGANDKEAKPNKQFYGLFTNKVSRKC
jgi:hypothetical protein